MRTALLIGSLTGGVLGAGTAALVAKKAKKPIGSKGSAMHILTNDKLDEQAKKDTFKQIGKQNLKDAGKIAGATAVLSGAAALATKSTKVSTFLKDTKALFGEGLSEISINNENLKSMIKDTKIFKKVNALPKPLKAAIATATAALTILIPVWALKSARDAGYIEAQNEK